MNNEERYFLDTAKNIIENGISSEDRTGIGTKYLFSQKFDYDISDGKIPIWTTRKIPWRNQVWELIWFIRGDTNINFLTDKGVNIWNSWADENGSVGPIYGKQLRRFQSVKYMVSEYEAGDHEHIIVDQFKELIDGIKNNPESRRHIISLWNPGEHINIEKPYLSPCHSNHLQIVIDNNKKELYYQMVQRSADFMIGYCPWQHALFANIIGRLTGYKPKQMSIIVTNCHIYKNQFNSAFEQIKRTPTQFPTLKMNENIRTIEDVENSCLEDYELINYSPQSFIKFPIAV